MSSFFIDLEFKSPITIDFPIFPQPINPIFLFIIIPLSFYDFLFLSCLIIIYISHHHPHSIACSTLHKLYVQVRRYDDGR
ncbi:hypothetical protein C6H62_13325 [Clostridium chauvoei]|nr:hypothetical protein C6H62_13325 [Clostridium chauvoei]